MTEYLSRIDIIAVGVWQYQHIRRLHGPQLDVQNLKLVLVENQDLSLYSPERFQEVLNPTAHELRNVITEYVNDRSADNNILLFYFAGHGAPIGSSDFAFCTVDTRFHPDENNIYPMTAVSFSDILRTLWIRKVTPVLFIDTCYSGRVGVSISQLVNEMKGVVQRNYASSYALFCSAPDDEEVIDNPDGDGGFFSNGIFSLIHGGVQGVSKRSNYVSLGDLYHPIRQRADRSGIGPVPMLFLGETLPDIPIAKNVDYQPLEYSLTNSLFLVLKVLWNDGHVVELRPQEILKVIFRNDWGGTGGFGNSTKLSRHPWALIDITKGRKRTMNERGVAFMQGNVSVPREIIDDGTGNYLPKPGTEQISIHNFNDLI